MSRPSRRDSLPLALVTQSHEAATNLCKPSLPGASWVRSTHGAGTADSHNAWHLTINLERLNEPQIEQLCKGACLPRKFMTYLRGSSETEIVVIFLERNFLEEKHGRDAASEFVSAEIGCSTSQWIAWLLIGGSHALLEQQTECGEGEKKGVYFIPKRGLGPNK